MKHIDYTFVKELQEHLLRVQAKKKVLDKARPLPAALAKSIGEALSVEWTYNSNSIEGNSLTLRETHMVLNDGLTIGGKSLREHFEALNHNEAVNQLEGLVKPGVELRQADVFNLHKIIMKNIDDEFGGRLRTGGVRVTGADFTPPNALKVPELLDELFVFVQNNPDKLDVVVLVTIFHHRFVYIHPFFDGNGRTVRLAMNLLLMKEGYPPAIILRNDRKKYYSALNQANNGNYAKLALLMIQALERSLNIYVSALPDSDTKYRSISSIVEEPVVPYGQEYLSLLARRGLIDAHKEGRNWVTTKEAVLEYAASKGK